MPARNKRSKHQRVSKQLRISPAEIERGNKKIRAERQQAEEEELKKQEKRAKELQKFEQKPAKPKNYDLRSPSFFRPIDGLPVEIEDAFSHRVKSAEIFSSLSVIAIFAGEPKKPNTFGKVSEAMIIQKFNKLCLTGKLPKNLVAEFGHGSTESNPRQCRLVNTALNLDENPNPRAFALDLGIRLDQPDKFIDLSDLDYLNRQISEEDIVIGAARDFNDEQIGPTRYRRAEESSNHAVPRAFFYR